MSATMSKRERVLAAVAGKTVDRVPVSAWGHLIPAETSVEALAEASLRDFHEFGWDWMKVNPRASLFAEGFGAIFDLENYHGVLPRLVRGLSEPFDPASLPVVTAETGVWADHVRLLELIRKGIDGAPFVQTIFSPLSVLGYLLGTPGKKSQEAAAAEHAEKLLDLIRTRPGAAHQALDTITRSLEHLVRASIGAGADGIFLAITRLARKGALTESEFLEFGKPYDLRLLEAVRASPFNVFHLCGPEVYWDLVQDYPVQAINWAAVGQNNPDLAAARKTSRFALVGGVDEAVLLRQGSPEEVEQAARRAILAGGPRGFLLAPGCCVEPDVKRTNLSALRRAAGV